MFGAGKNGISNPSLLVHAIFVIVYIEVKCETEAEKEKCLMDIMVRLVMPRPPSLGGRARRLRFRSFGRDIYTYKGLDEIWVKVTFYIGDGPAHE